MEYARYVGRVGALAVALGIGVAVANGGIANATTDPDPNQDTSQEGHNLDASSTDDNDTETQAGTEGPQSPTVVLNGVEQDDDEDATTRRRVKPRLMILDVLRGANIFGARRADDAEPLKQPKSNQDEEQQDVDPTGGGTAAKLTAPSGSDPVKQAAADPRIFQHTIAAIAAPPKPRLTPAAAVPQGPVKTAAAVVDPNQVQRQTAAITGPSALVAPPPVPALAPKPGSFVINLLSSIGLRPDAFPSGSPLAPIGQLLEYAYAGLRRFDRTFFNETPTATPLIVDTNTATGVVTGRVATDYEGDALRYKMIDGPDHGEVVLNPDGTFVYTPNRDETRDEEVTDAFTVVVSDRTNFHLHLFSPGGHTTTVTVSGITVAPNNTVVDSIGDGSSEAVVERPDSVAFNKAGTRAYISDRDADAVHVFDTSDNHLIASIPITPDSSGVAFPAGLATVVRPDGKEYLYVASSHADTVTIIDTADNSVVKTLNLSTPTTIAGLQDVAASPDGTKVYVTGFYGVHVINTSTDTVDTAAFISLRDDPLDSNRYDIAITPSGQFAYVPDYAGIGAAGGDINLINLSTREVVRIPAAPDRNIEDAVISPDGRYVYLSGESLIVLDTTTNTIVDRIDEITDPRGLALSPDGKRLYVTRVNFDNLTVVDTESLAIVDTIPLDDPLEIGVTPDGTRAYVIRSQGISIDRPQIYVIALQAPSDPAMEV